MSLVIQGDKSSPIIIPQGNSVSPIKENDFFTQSFDQALKTLLNDLFDDLSDFYSKRNEAVHDPKSAIESAFLNEFKNLPCKLNENIGFGNIVLLANDQPIYGNYESSILAITTIFQDELAELNFSERKKLLDEKLKETKPDIYQILHPDVHDKTPRRRRRKTSPKTTEEKISETAKHLQIKHESALTELKEKDQRNRFSSFEDGIKELLKGLVAKIECEHGFGSYKIVSKLFINAFDALPEQLKKATQSSDKPSLPLEQLQYEQLFKAFKKQFKDDLAAINENDLCDYLLNGLKHTYPQYFRSVFNDRGTPQREIEQWEERFSKAAKARQNDEIECLLLDWCEAVASSPALCRSQKLWDLFYTAANAIHYSKGNDPLEIENKFQAGAFDNAIASLATDPMRCKSFYNFILGRAFDRECLKSITKHKELSENFPLLLDGAIFKEHIAPAMDDLRFLDEAKLPLLELFDTYPSKIISKQFVQSFFLLFCQLPSLEANASFDEHAKLIPHLRNLLNKIMNYSKSELDLFLVVLSAVKSPPLCDLAIEFAIHARNDLLRDKKVKIEDLPGHHTFYLGTFSKALSNCSKRGIDLFKENGFSKKWVEELKLYKLDYASPYAIFIAKAVKYANPSSKIDDPFHDLNPHLQEALKLSEISDYLVETLLTFVFDTIEMKNSEMTIVLSNRLCFLINLICKNVPYNDKKNRASGLMGHQLFWDILYRVAKKAKESDDNKSGYIAALIFTMSILTEKEIYNNPGSVTIILPLLLSAFNRAAESTWGSFNTPEENRLSYLLNNIFHNYFTKKHFISTLNASPMMQTRNTFENSEANADRTELFTFFEHVLTFLNDSAKAHFPLMKLTDANPSQIQEFYNSLCKLQLIHSTIWATNGVPQELKVKSWELSANTTLSSIKLICQSFPDSFSKEKMQFKGFLDGYFKHQTLCLEDEINRESAIPILQRQRPNDKYEFAFKTVDRLIAACHQNEKPALLINDYPLLLASALIKNLIQSPEERLSLCNKILKYIATYHSQITINDSTINFLFEMMIIASDPNYDPTPLTPLQPMEQKSVAFNLNRLISLLENLIVSENNAGAYLVALKIINKYMQNVSEDRFNCKAVLTFLNKILQDLSKKTTILTGYDTVYFQLFKIVMEQMNNQELVEKLMITPSTQPEEANINLAVASFTRSRSAELHGIFRIFISHLIKSGLSFNTGIAVEKNIPEAKAKQNDFRENLTDFVIGCKNLSIGNTSKITPPGNASRIYFENVLKNMIKQDPDNKREIECVEAILALI